MTDKADNDALADLIETRLFGVAPDDQDLVLEDDDWRTILAALRTPRPEVDGADAQADAELVAAYPELAEHTDDPWFAVGFLREKFERSEAERAIWKERAMTMRIEPTHPQPDETETLRAEVARLRLELEVIQSLIEDEAYKITAGQSICKHIAALNEIHDTTIAALKGTDHGRG